MEPQIELTEEKSQELAYILEFIKMHIHSMDIEYARALARGMFEQATRQETLSVLNPSYPSKKNDLIRTQAKALQALVLFVDLLKECDKMKADIALEGNVRESIAKMFL